MGVTFSGNLKGAKERNPGPKPITPAWSGEGSKPPHPHSDYPLIGFGPGFLSWAPFKFPKNETALSGTPFRVSHPKA